MPHSTFFDPQWRTSHVDHSHDTKVEDANMPVSDLPDFVQEQVKSSMGHRLDNDVVHRGKKFTHERQEDERSVAKPKWIKKWQEDETKKTTMGTFTHNSSIPFPAPNKIPASKGACPWKREDTSRKGDPSTVAPSKHLQLERYLAISRDSDIELARVCVGLPRSRLSTQPTVISDDLIHAVLISVTSKSHTSHEPMVKHGGEILLQSGDQIGVCVLDTRLLKADKVSEVSPTTILRTYSFCLEHSNPATTAAYLYGRNEIVAIEDIKCKLDKIMNRKRRNYFIFHDLRHGLRVLQEMDFDLNTGIWGIFDVQRLTTQMLPTEKLVYSLDYILFYTGVGYYGLHVAGNEANFTMKAFLASAVHDFRREKYEHGRGRIRRIVREAYHAEPDGCTGAEMMLRLLHEERCHFLTKVARALYPDRQPPRVPFIRHMLAGDHEYQTWRPPAANTTMRGSSTQRTTPQTADPGENSPERQIKKKKIAA